MSRSALFIIMVDDSSVIRNFYINVNWASGPRLAGGNKALNPQVATFFLRPFPNGMYQPPGSDHTPIFKLKTHHKINLWIIIYADDLVGALIISYASILPSLHHIRSTTVDRSNVRTATHIMPVKGCGSLQAEVMERPTLNMLNVPVTSKTGIVRIYCIKTFDIGFTLLCESEYRNSWT